MVGSVDLTNFNCGSVGTASLQSLPTLPSVYLCTMCMHWKKQFTKPMAGQTLLKGPISDTGFMINTGFVDGEKNQSSSNMHKSYRW